MTKTILITGATDGIGLETARSLSSAGQHLILHGRNSGKLAAVAEELRKVPSAGPIETVEADLSDLAQVAQMGMALRDAGKPIDVLINNAGVYKIANPVSRDGEDLRFIVNTFAPALLVRLLLPIISAHGRFVHLSSAAQAPVDLAALAGKKPLTDMAAYAQSKLASTVWSQSLADQLDDEQVTVAINPGSLLATNMVRKGFGVSGNDISIGVDILTRAALSDEFATASGKYFDNDSGRFAAPQADASNPQKVAAIVEAIENQIARYLEEPQNA